MKTAAIVSEYNPFHNGHRRQTEILRSDHGITHIIGIMSGNFTQRGAPAMADKFLRAEMAIRGGCDLILELPAVFAVSSAEFFAEGAVSIADSLGGIQYLSFGMENPDGDFLMKAAALLNEEPEEYRHILTQELKAGQSFPAARQKAAEAVLGKEASHVLSSPNSILAVEYTRSLLRKPSSIDVIPIRREGLGYHEVLKGDEECNPSATAIRELLRSHGQDNPKESLKESLKNRLSAYIPHENVDLLLENFLENYRESSASYGDRVLDLAIYRLMMNKELIFRIPESSDGLGERIVNNLSSLRGSTMEEVLRNLSTRRFTSTRIRRLLLHTALNLDTVDYDRIRRTPPTEVRILALNRKGMEFLKSIRKTRNIEILDTLNGYRSEALKIDEMAGTLYSFLDDRWSPERDFLTNPVIV